MQPVICPLCGGLMERDPEDLTPFACTHCGKGLVPARNGKALVLTPAAQAAAPLSQGEQQAEALLRQAEKAENPVQRHQLLTQAQALAPDYLPVERELLHLGRLHQRNQKRIDFSVIKCYLLNLFDEPENYSAQQRAAVLMELFADPQLLRCMGLAEDGEAFLRAYLDRLCAEYIRLFLKGSSRYNGSIFGITLTKPEKTLAGPAARMLQRMSQETDLDFHQRALLKEAFQNAFQAELGNSAYLEQALNR